jgi:hypothetical protein
VDYATTCLVRAARAECGVECASSDGLAAGFDDRGGLYFANPYLTDWALALALRGDADDSPLAARLVAEILASRNADGSFGAYDVALSTALAILALTALGYRGRAMRLAQLRLLDAMSGDGTWPAATPFYSTLRAAAGAPRSRAEIAVHDRRFGLTWYRDDHRMMTTALATLALLEDYAPRATDPRVPASPHPRYRAVDHADYVARFALPPYVSAPRDASPA